MRPAVRELASLPSLDELRGKLIGLLQAPAARLARVLQAPAGQVARVLAAYAESQGEAPSLRLNKCHHSLRKSGVEHGGFGKTGR